MHKKYYRKRRRTDIFIGSILFLLLALWILLSPSGYLKYYQVKNQYNKLRKLNSELKTENQSLRIEIDKLKNDEKYIEEIARKEYGMLKKNEVVYQFPQK